MLALVPALLLAQAKPAPDSVEAGAWITHVEGRVFFQNFEKAEADMAVNPGDELNTQNGRIEVEIGEGNWIRLDQHTRVVFTDIQKDSAKLSLWEGSIYLRLKNQAVEVRSPKEEHLFQDKGLVRINIDQNETKIIKNPRVADDFDGWNRSRDEEMASSESEAGRYRSPWFYGGAFSPFWSWSSLDWYGWFYPYWSCWRPFLWSYYSWPGWYFGCNPFWFGNPWFFGYGSYFGGFYARGGRSFNGVIRRGELRQPRGLEGGPNRMIRHGSSARNSIASIYPSRIPTRAIRSSSYSAASRTAYRTVRSSSTRSTARRSSSRSSGGSRAGGGRRR
jgi:hypothetical protein